MVELVGMVGMVEDWLLLGLRLGHNITPLGDSREQWLTGGKRK
ncbi:unnamed protein product [marine sediment metagenome]|uniref:Uncharacterized protein n=1 Tax=marine sediment metagenome TaxID=412755 RepID=X1MKH1_9ZZZZ